MEQLKENHQATLLIVYPHRFKFQRNSLTTTTTVAYLNLAVIQNACIIQMIENSKGKDEESRQATRAKQAVL